jgi:hypothetical protein
MSFPTTPKASSIKITGISPTLTSVTHSLKRQARSRGAQRWMIDAKYPPMSRGEFAPLWAFANAQQGQYGTFLYTPPIYKDTSGTATGTLLVNGTGIDAGDSSITCDGLTGLLKAGDFIKFAGHDKVYTLTSDASTTLSIEPPLMSAVADDEAITYTDVPFTMAFANDKQIMSVGTNQLIGFSIKLVEVV